MDDEILRYRACRIITGMSAEFCASAPREPLRLAKSFDTVNSRMNKPDKSEDVARAILNHYLSCVENRFSDSVEAVILVGSLATGSYVPGPGDIDQITIVRDEAAAEVAGQLSSAIEDAMNAFHRPVHLSPVIYRRSELERPWQSEWDLDSGTKHTVCVPEELLRIHDHGLVLYGSGVSTGVFPMPTREEMIQYHRSWQEWNDACSRKMGGNESLPLRIEVQIILSNAIWHYYYATGRTCFNKHTIADRLASEVPSYRFQRCVELAAKIRKSGLGDTPEDILMAIKRGCHAIVEWQKTHSPEAIPAG